MEVLEDRLLLSTLYALLDPNQLLTFDSSTPNNIARDVTITGLNNNEKILGIAFRPKNGVLYGVGSANDLYTIDPGSGVATPVGSPFGGTLKLNYLNLAGCAFDPVQDQLRVVTDAGQNFRLNPDTAAVLNGDSGVPGDSTNFTYGDSTSGNPALDALAYANPVAGATSTTAYGIDFSSNEALAKLGDPGRSPPVSANSGKVFTVGKLGPNATFMDGICFAADGTLYASFPTADGGVSLYVVAPSTGDGTLVGLVGDGTGTIHSLAAAPAQVVQFSAPTYTVQAGASTVQATITVDRLGGSSGSVTVNYQTTSGGTAVAGTDYNSASGTLFWNDGDTSSKQFTVTILSDPNAGGDKTVNLALGQPSAGTVLGVQGTAVLTIQEPAPVETVQLESATYAVAKGAGTTQLQVLVDRTGGTAGTVDVPFQVSDSSAVAGRDYTVVSTSPLVFQPGVGKQAITIDILGNSPSGSDESFTVALGIPTSPDGSASPSAGPTSEAAVTILEPETFTISGLPTIREDGNVATFTITRLGPTAGDATIHSSFGGSAIAGVDFGLLPGPLIIPAGQATTTLPIPILNSGQYDGDESLVVTLTSVSLSTTNAAGLGSSHSATTKILESNPQPPPPPPLPPPDLVGNVTSFVKVAMPRSAHSRHTHSNVQQLILTDMSGSPLLGPVSLVLVGLNKHIKLIGRTGIATAWGPFPYLNVLADGALLAPDAPMTVLLQFADPGRLPLHYVPILIAGPGGR
jgi:hypothetical protein